MPLTRLPAQKVRAHREPTPVREGGRVEAYTYPTPGAELDNIADILRRAHLEDGVPWREMAVLVRAGGRSIPSVRRALTSAGVPLDIDGDDLPLRHEPAVAPLLGALRAAARAALDTGPDATAIVESATDGDAGTAPETAADARRRHRRQTPVPTPPVRRPPPGSTPKPPWSCSPRPWAAWTPPTCGAWAAPCARRNARPAGPCPAPPTN